MPFSSNLSSAAPAFNHDLSSKNAIEHASAPGLTLSQRYQRLRESVNIPNLMIDSPGQAPNQGRAHEKMCALQQFKTTPQYQVFKSQVTHTLVELDRIANSCRSAGMRNTHFQDLGQGLWEPVAPNMSSRFGAFQADLYQQACPDATLLLRMHEFARQKPQVVAAGGADNARACISELSERLDVCGPGLVQHVEEATQHARQVIFTPSLAERFEAMRIQIARNAIAEFVNQNPDRMGNWVGNEVHKVAAWQNYFSRYFHLPLIDDVFASSSYIENKNHQNQLAGILNVLQTPSAVATTIASQTLEKANDLWQQSKAKGVTDLGQHCMQLIEEVSKEHGAVEPHTLFELDEDGMPCAIHTNPTLLALSIIRQTEKSPELHTQPENVWHCTPRFLDRRVGGLSIRGRGQLLWMETAPPRGVAGEAEKQLLSMKNLKPEQARTFLDLVSNPGSRSTKLMAALHEILRNDWGSHLPHCKSMAFDWRVPSDVFVNLALGFSEGLELEHVDTRSIYRDVMTKAIQNLECSQVLKQCAPSRIVTMLNAIHDLNSNPSMQHAPLNVFRVVNEITFLKQHNVSIALYNAALEFNWTHQYGKSAEQAWGNIAFFTADRAYGIAYVDMLAKHAPHLLTDTLCKNIRLMACPEVALRFLDVGASFNATRYGEPSALQCLLQHPNDAFMAIVLTSLAHRGVSLQEVANSRNVEHLRRRDMFCSANVLNARIA